MMKHFVWASLWLLLFLPATGWAKVQVVVSIVPQKYFVEKIAGDLAEVTVMVPPNASPATYEPRPSQMRALSRADLYFAIGVPFEKAWLPRFAAQNPKMKIVDITEGIRKVPMASHHHHGHRASETENRKTTHSLDPHVWLSPPLVKILARNIAEALEKADPVHADAYRKNFAAFERDLDALFVTLKKRLAPCRGHAMMVFHPSWGYFARAFGLKQIPIEIEGKEPRSRELMHLIEEAKEHHVRAIFIQPQFSRRAAEVIARSIGAGVIVADPMAYDWKRNLLSIADKVCEAAR